MTTDTLILVKLNRALNAIVQNNKALAFDALVDMVKAIFPCDAAVLLQGSGSELRIASQQGLTEQSKQRIFNADEHPRLKQILSKQEWVRFDADSDLPDPYDGLLENYQGPLPVHDCMGSALYQVDGQQWGAITFDALRPAAFDQLDPNLLKVVTELACLCLSLERNIDTLAKTQETLIAEAPKIIGSSGVMANLLESIDAVANTELNVLIQGESGSGKELIAQRVHAQSRLRKAVYVTLNCATLPSELAESELFGHEKGAFTGAEKAKRGKFELADNGTLFLDEIGELPLDLQAKLLRALQQGEIQRLGSETTIRVNCRIIAATNRNLANEVSEGHFREDLYHRLNVYPVIAPPLRSRREDIPTLTEHFTQIWKNKTGVKSVAYSPQAMQLLSNYDWPGNVRELENLVARLLVMLKSKMGDELHINASDIPIGEIATTQNDTAGEPTINPANIVTQGAFNGNPTLSLQEQTAEFQKAVIRNALEDNDNTWSKAATQLGIDRANLARLAKRLGVKS